MRWACLRLLALCACCSWVSIWLVSVALAQLMRLHVQRQNRRAKIGGAAKPHMPYPRSSRCMPYPCSSRWKCTIRAGACQTGPFPCEQAPIAFPNYAVCVAMPPSQVSLSEGGSQGVTITKGQSNSESKSQETSQGIVVSKDRSSSATTTDSVASASTWSDSTTSGQTDSFSRSGWRHCSCTGQCSA